MNNYAFIEIDIDFSKIILNENDLMHLQIASLNLSEFNDRVKPNEKLILIYDKNGLKPKKEIFKGKLQIERLISNINQYASFYVNNKEGKITEAEFMNLLYIQTKILLKKLEKKLVIL